MGFISFNSDQQQDLKNVVSNIEQPVLWSYKVWTHIWILGLSKTVGENHEFYHMIGVQTLLMRINEKDQE